MLQEKQHGAVVGDGWSTTQFFILNGGVPEPTKNGFHVFRALRRADGVCIAMGSVVVCSISSEAFRNGAPWLVATLMCKSPHACRNRDWAVTLCTGDGSIWASINPSNIASVVNEPSTEQIARVTELVERKQTDDTAAAAAKEATKK